jgi:hypothetical protein
MSIRLLCPNNHELIVEPAYIGRKVRCPACKVVMVVPNPNPAAVAPAPVHPQVAPQPVPQPVPPPVPQRIPQPVPQPVPQPLPAHGLHQGPPLPPPMPAAPPRPRRRPPQDELEEVPEEVVYEEEERPRPRKLKTRHRMQRVSLGLAFHYFKILCYLVMMLTFLIGSIVASTAARAGSGFVVNLVGVMVCFSMILVMVTPVLGFVGSLLCLWVPQKTGAKPLIIVSFGLDSGAIGLGLLSVITSFTAGASAAGGSAGTAMGMAGASLIFIILSPLVAFAGWILFMLFLRNLAYYFGDDATGDEALTVMVLTIAIGFGGAVGLFVLALLLRNTGQVALFVLGVASLAWMIAMIKVLFRALHLIGTLRVQLNSRYG